MMIYKSDHHNLLDEFINDFSEGKLSKAELQSFSELQNIDPEIKRTARSGIQARKNLKNLKPVTCRPGFDQRMAAKFALELENEVQSINQSSERVAETLS